MTAPTKLTETRAIGWYAIRRVRLADWFKQHGRRRPQTSVPEPQSQMDEATETNGFGPNGYEGDKPSRGDNQQSAEEKLRTVVEESHTLLAKTHAIFPFDLFPDTISLDRHKLTIVHREFFFVEQTVSVPIENIKNIEANIGPFLGSLTITSDLFTHNTQQVKYLSNAEARRFHKLVQGAVVAQREDVNLNDIDTDKLCDMLIDLGSGHSHTVSQ